MLQLHIATANIICTAFTIAAAVTWGTSLALAGFKPSNIAGLLSKNGKEMLSILCMLFLSSFSHASGDFVVSGNRLICALIVLTFAGFFAGTVFGTLWRTDTAQ